MGMYDTIRFDGYKIEGLPPNVDPEFQTKDLLNELAVFKVDSKGKLFVEESTTVEVPEEERPLYGTSDWDDPVIGKFARWIGSLKKQHIKWAPYNYTGTIIAYSCDVPELEVNKLREAKPSIWVDLTLKFKDGKLIDVSVSVEDY